MTNLNEENEEQEGTIIDTNQEDDSNDFDSSSFISDDSVINTGDENDSDDNNSDDDDDDDSDGIWENAFADEDDSEDDTSEDLHDDDNDSDDEDDSAPDSAGDQNASYEVLNKFKEIGLEANDVEDLVKTVQGVLQEREIYQQGKYTNKNIDNWKKALNLEDRELVKKNFIAQGADEADAEAMTVSLESNDMVRTKSHEIRVAVRQSISREQESIKAKESADVAKQQEGTERAKKALQDHLEGTTTMFGFKMGKEGDLGKIRKKHFDYIQSGKFFKDVTASEVSIAEAAWFQANKAQIIKALKNKGVQTGRQEILDDINNATADESFRSSGNDGNNEFNPSKFASE